MESLLKSSNRIYSKSDHLEKQPKFKKSPEFQLCCKFISILKSNTEFSTIKANCLHKICYHLIVDFS